ncbi:MAG: hypothetical protein M3R00_05700 [Pseudomonadota bacterium]|nr:hypothetical protein [Pseudomonadota bacterium]
MKKKSDLSIYFENDSAEEFSRDEQNDSEDDLLPLETSITVTLPRPEEREISRIALILKYTATNPANSLLSRALGIIVPVGIATCKSLEVTRYAETPLQIFVYPLSSGIAYFLFYRLITSEIVAVVRTKQVRKLIGDNRKCCGSTFAPLTAIRTNLPLLGCFTLASIPAVFNAITADQNSWWSVPCTIASSIGTLLLFTTALESITSAAYNRLCRVIAKGPHYLCGNNQASSYYMLSDRLLTVETNVRDHVALHSNYAFPEILLPMLQASDDSPENCIGSLVGYAKTRGLIEIAIRPKKPICLKIVPAFVGFTVSAIVIASLLGFWANNQTRYDMIFNMTRTNHYTHSTAEVIGTTWLKFSLLGFFSFYYLGYFARFGYRFGNTVAQVFLNLCRLQFDRPWIMHLMPILSISCVIVGIASALFTSSQAVALINAIPLDYRLFGFIPITSAIKDLCKICADLGFPVALGTAGVIALLRELETITARAICIPTTLQTQAQFLRGLDQAMPLTRQLDSHGLFGHNFSLLKTVRTHKQAGDYSADSYVYYDLLNNVADADSVGRRASGVYAETREDTHLTRVNRSRNDNNYNALPASENEEDSQPVYQKSKSCSCEIL